LSAFITHILTYVGPPAALVLTVASSVGRVSRALLLYRAGSTALKQGSEDERGRAGLEIVKALTRRDEPWYRAILPWRRSDDGEPCRAVVTPRRLSRRMSPAG
jgi:hypothetical protein